MSEVQTLDWLCKEIQRIGGERKYICDPKWMVNLSEVYPNDTEKHKKKIVQLIEKMFQYIERRTNRTIDCFYIGKTYVQDKVYRNYFDSMDPDTWIKTGISSRWHSHKESDHGLDGMVVLTVITREVDTYYEEYTLELEKMIIDYYRTDTRLDNTTLLSGRKDGGKSIGYALYVTFTLGPPLLSARSQQVQPSSASFQTLRSLPEVTLTTWDGPSRYSSTWLESSSHYRTWDGLSSYSSTWLGSSRHYRTWDGPSIYSSTFLGPSRNLEMLSQRSWYH